MTDYAQVQKLRTAIQEYDNDRWRIISGKVGNGFSAGACRDKAIEMEVENTGHYGMMPAEYTLHQGDYSTET